MNAMIKMIEKVRWKLCKNKVGATFAFKSELFASRGIKRCMQHVAKVILFVTRCGYQTRFARLITSHLVTKTATFRK